MALAWQALLAIAPTERTGPRRPPLPSACDAIAKCQMEMAPTNQGHFLLANHWQAAKHRGRPTLARARSLSLTDQGWAGRGGAVRRRRLADVRRPRLFINRPASA